MREEQLKHAGMTEEQLKQTGKDGVYHAPTDQWYFAGEEPPPVIVAEPVPLVEPIADPVPAVAHLKTTKPGKNND